MQLAEVYIWNSAAARIDYDRGIYPVLVYFMFTAGSNAVNLLMG